MTRKKRRGDEGGATRTTQGARRQRSSQLVAAAVPLRLLKRSRLRLRQAKKVNEAAVYDGAQRIHWRHEGVLYTHLVDKTSGPSRFASAT